jgi:hypothetical protein
MLPCAWQGLPVAAGCKPQQASAHCWPDEQREEIYVQAAASGRHRIRAPPHQGTTASGHHRIRAPPHQGTTASGHHRIRAPPHQGATASGRHRIRAPPHQGTTASGRHRIRAPPHAICRLRAQRTMLQMLHICVHHTMCLTRVRHDAALLLQAASTILPRSACCRATRAHLPASPCGHPLEGPCCAEWSGTPAWHRAPATQ